MADKKRKTQAEKAASAAKSKSNSKKKNDASAKKNNSNVASAPVKQNDEGRIPVRFITSCVSLGLFILLLILYTNPEGAITKFVANVILGLFGQVGFLVAIPALLYLFIIHAFSGKRPVRMRTICLGCFVLFCGTIAHLSLNPEYLSGGIKVIGELYVGGVNSATGGVICGGLAMFMKALFGVVLSYIILILAAVLSLLAAMQITIPSIVRAIKNRPRADWEDEEKPEQPEPAAVVVNHLATKRIAHIENRRNKALQTEGNPDNTPPAGQEIKSFPQQARVSDMMRQIDDVSAPVSAAGITVTPDP